MSNTKVFLVIYICLLATFCYSQQTKERVIILADMGHDPDDEQQIVHLLTKSNELQLEGLITQTGRFFRPDPPALVKDLRPYLFHHLIDGYDKVYPNLLLHSKDWPTPAYLHSIVKNGQKGNGMEDVKAGNSSAGSQWIIEAVEKKDSRPLNIVINAGANTLAQALIDYRANHTAEELKVFIKKLLVYDNAGQDDAGAWICHEFSDIFWIRSNAQNKAYGGPTNDNLGPHVWKPFPFTPLGQDAWADKHIRFWHGPLGAVYQHRKVNETTHFIEGGGMIPILAFCNPALSNMSEPSWGGWGGRFNAEKSQNVSSSFEIVHSSEKLFEPYKMYAENQKLLDTWVNPEDGKTYNDTYTPVWRWRQAMWNDFRARMDWCVMPYEKANHHPVAVLNGDNSNQIIQLKSKPGKVIKLDASTSTDQDQNQLSFNWWFYKEAGSKPYLKTIQIKYISPSKVQFEVPKDASRKELHLILEVSDNHPEVSLVSYRRVVIKVE